MEDEGLGAVEAERHLGGDRGEEVVAAAFVVVEEELLEGSPKATAVALPQQGSSCEATGLDQGELLVADAVEALVVGGPPGHVGGGQVVSLDRLGEEMVEDLVGEGPARQGRDAVLVGGLVEGPDSEDVPHEVGVRAPDPVLEPGGGEDGVAVGGRGEFDVVEQAVEAGQFRILASPDEGDAAVEHHVGQSSVAHIREEAPVTIAEIAMFPRSYYPGMSRALLKLGGGSGEILRDVHL